MQASKCSAIYCVEDPVASVREARVSSNKAFKFHSARHVEYQTYHCSRHGTMYCYLSKRRFFVFIRELYRLLGFLGQGTCLQYAGSLAGWIMNIAGVQYGVAILSHLYNTPSLGLGTLSVIFSSLEGVSTRCNPHPNQKTVCCDIDDWGKNIKIM